jgi:hypothetical protein
LNRAESSRFSISGEILTSNEFLEKWKKYYNSKQNKQKLYKTSNRDKDESEVNHINVQVKRGKGRPKKTQIKRKEKRVLETIEEEGKKDIREYTEQLQQLLEDHIQQDIIIRKALPEEVEEEDLEDSNGEADVEDKIIVNNYDDDDEVQKKYLLASLTEYMNTPEKSLTKSSLMSSPKNLTESLRDKILKEGHDIYEVKGDGVCVFYIFYHYYFLLIFFRTASFVHLLILFFKMKVNITMLEKLFKRISLKNGMKLKICSD